MDSADQAIVKIAAWEILYRLKRAIRAFAEIQQGSNVFMAHLSVN